MSETVFEDEENYFFRGFLSFHPDLGVKWTAREPNAAKGSRIMGVEFSLPKSLFEIPQLSARIQVSDAGQADVKINMEAVKAALEASVGCSVVVETVEASK